MLILLLITVKSKEASTGVYSASEKENTQVSTKQNPCLSTEHLHQRSRGTLSGKAEASQHFPSSSCWQEIELWRATVPFI